MVGERAIRNVEFLKQLVATRSPRNRQDLLRGASADEILTIVEVCVNVLRARFPIKAKERARLKNHATYLRKLSRVRSEKSARHLLQVGEGIPMAALLVPVIAEIARQLIKQHI